MTITIKATRKTREVLIDIPKHMRKHRQGLENALYEHGPEVIRETKRLIINGPKTGRIYTIRGARHQASAPGEAPANRTGKLAKSGNYNVHGPFQMEVGESVPYAGYLEDGTGKIKPRPHVIRAINETQGDAVRVFYDEVKKVRGK